MEKTIEAGGEFNGVKIEINPEVSAMDDRNYVDDFRGIIPINSTAPTHTPRKWVDCFYEDGTANKFYAYIDGAWQQLALYSDIMAKSAGGSFNRSTSGDLTITTNFTPKMIRFTGFYPEDGASMCWGFSAGDAGSHYCMYTRNNGGVETRTRDTDYVINLADTTAAKTLVGVVSAVTSTNFTVTFTAAGTPGACQVIWEAIG